MRAFQAVSGWWSATTFRRGDLPGAHWEPFAARRRRSRSAAVPVFHPSGSEVTGQNGRRSAKRAVTHRSFRPDAVRYTSVTTATHRPAVTHPDTWRDKEKTARRAAFPQQAGRFRRWWQVLGSNQRRLSRRFYRPLPLATRATCRMPQRWRHRKDSRRRDRTVSGIRLSG